MIHRYNKGNTDKVIVMLHGTGGNESDLLQLAHFIDPQAHKIGIRGRVQENGMNRYFKRYPDGSFDLESLDEESRILYQEINQLLSNYNLNEENVTIIGYSNGANIFLNILRLFTTQYDQAILFHPSRSNTVEPFKDQSLDVFLTYGDQDPFVSTEDFTHLENDLKNAGIDVETYTHEQGHSLTQDELDNARLFYAK